MTITEIVLGSMNKNGIEHADQHNDHDGDDENEEVRHCVVRLEAGVFGIRGLVNCGNSTNAGSNGSKTTINSSVSLLRAL